MAEQKVDVKAEQKAERPPETIILKDKQARIIMSLRVPGQDWYLSSLAKATDTTYVHACRFIGMCEGLGITTSEHHGKIKVIRLTDKGMQIAELIASIYGMMGLPQKAADQPTEKAKEKEKEK
jgi:predicted transcriptional regulator